MILKFKRGDFLKKLVWAFALLTVMTAYLYAVEGDSTAVVGTNQVINNSEIITQSALAETEETAAVTTESAVTADIYEYNNKKFKIDSDADVETGNATWYGRTFHGRKTTSGEKFDMNKFTAAHRNYKFGTVLKVTNLKTSKYVIVKVNDRCHAAPKKILIDLAQKAYLEIGTKFEGIVKVKIEVLKEIEN